MDNKGSLISETLKEQIRIEEYKGLKEEIFTSIKQQFTILAMTISAVTMVLTIMVNTIDIPGNNRGLSLCLGILLPGAIVFCGILWMDQVYRHRRLAVKIYQIEKELAMDGETFGWEHFIRDEIKKKPKTKWFRYYRPCEWMYYLATVLSLVIFIYLSVEGAFLLDGVTNIVALGGVLMLKLEIIIFDVYKQGVETTENILAKPAQ